MSNNNKLFKLGDYVLDVEQLILFSDNEEVQAEPKTIELLVYLMQQGDRYVKLEELHQQVWHGRIVSDTAVRNVIKKLRNALHDTDLADSRYIKSVPKRGYKLICQVSPIGNEFTSNVEENDDLASFVVYEKPVEAVLSSSGGSGEMIRSTPFPIYIPKTVLFFFLSLIVIIAAGLFANHFGLEQHSSEKAYQFEKISNFPGEKYGVAVSENGKYLAFTGMTNVKQNSQVYLMDRHTGEIRQLTKTAKIATDVKFVKQDTAIIYNDSVFGKVSLNLIDLSTDEFTPEPLINEQPFIGRVINGINDDEILFPLKSKDSSSMMLYSLNLTSKKLARVTSTRHEEQHDYMAAISPNKDLIAIARIEGEQNYLSIREQGSQKEIRKVYLERGVYNLIWKEQESVYVLDSESLKLVNIGSGVVEEIVAGQTDLFFDVSLLSEDELVFVKHNSAEQGLFVERDLTNNVEVTRLFDVSNNIVKMAYSIDSASFLAVLKENNLQYLAIYKPDTQYTEIIETGFEITTVEIMDVNEQEKIALLMINSRVATLDFQTKQLTFHTTAIQKVGDASFSATGQSILFGEKVAGKWAVYEKSLFENSPANLVYANYRSIRALGEKYILADTDGNLFISHHGELQSLNHKISFALRSRWQVKGNTVIWTTTDDYETQLHSLDIPYLNHQVKKFQFGDFTPRFSISASGDKIIHKSRQLRDTSLVKFEI